MNCPKCKEPMDYVGQNTSVDSYSCRYCGNRVESERIKAQSELTPEQKLWWLVENVGVLSSRHRMQVRIRDTGKAFNCYWDKYGKSKEPDIENIAVVNRTEAVEQAYNKAREKR